MISLDLRDVFDESVVSTIHSIEAVGKKQYARYHKSVIVDRTNSIKKNKLALFRCPKPKAKTKQTKAFATLKDNVELFSRLYIVAQSRGSDMHSFFKHEK